MEVLRRWAAEQAEPRRPTETEVYNDIVFGLVRPGVYVKNRVSEANGGRSTTLVQEASRLLMPRIQEVSCRPSPQLSTPLLYELTATFTPLRRSGWRTHSGGSPDLPMGTGWRPCAAGRRSRSSQGGPPKRKSTTT